jgi:hypothetical protein
MSDYDEISHLISLHAQQQMQGFLPIGIGHVTAYDPNAQAVQVAFPGMPVIDPLSGAPTGEYSISPWVQLGSIWVGNGWGFQTAPEVGEAVPPFSGTQCAVYIQQRHGSFGLAGHLLFTANALPPDNTLVAGEAIFKHKSGTYLRFNSDGSLSINVAGNLPITLASGDVLSVNGTADALALVSKLVSAFNTHTHPDPEGGNTGVPVTQWSASTVESSLVKVAS